MSDRSPAATGRGALRDLDADLGRLWDAVAARLQRNGLEARGEVLFSELTTGERRALSGLLRRPVTGATARVSLVQLDERLRQTGVAAGLVPAVESLRGPLVDRPGLRRTQANRRAALWSAGRAAVAEAGLAGQPWVEPWLESLRASGALTRAGSEGEATLVRAVRCLARLPPMTGGTTPDLVGRTELATRFGGSHALDDGTRLSGIVLRALALATGTPMPADAADRRALWASAGVLADEVSDTVLTVGLRPEGDGPVAVGVRLRSAAGCESHLTVRDLRRVDRWVEEGTPVHLCENPRVLEASMDAGYPGPLVCTSGNPTVVTDRLVASLATSGAELRYRGDFDWPGVAIANRMVTRFGCALWRMTADDYANAVSASATGTHDLPVLEGPEVEALWDPGLRPAMARAGRAVHEEAMLDVLLGDLLGGRAASVVLRTGGGPDRSNG